MRRAVDLGCGTGALTLLLHQALSAEETLGIDSSLAMLARAQTINEPGLRFEQGDMSTWTSPEPFDVVFSNAALQWVGDHPALFKRIVGLIAADGVLAVQMPANFDHPSHRLAADVAREEPFASATGGYVRQPPVLAPERYAELLFSLGMRDIHVRLQIYADELRSAADVVEWTRGTLLTDYEMRMPAAMFDDYVRRYRERLLGVLGDARPYLYAFKRILLRARAA